MLQCPEAMLANATQHVALHAYHTPLLTSRLLNEQTDFDVRLKAELFQRGGSYKVRGPLNKCRLLTDEEKRRGIICSSAGNHAQGVALACRIHNIGATGAMKAKATQAKGDATRAYGAEVILHGGIWDEADAKARELVAERGYTYIHPFDDLDLIAGQGTLGWEIYQDFPQIDVAVVPIGGGGLISGVSMALKSLNPDIRIIGVESSGAPAMHESLAAGRLVTLDQVDCVIDGLTVKTTGKHTFAVVQQCVEKVVTLPDDEIFEAMLWVWTRCKLMVEGAAAAPVAALLNGLVDAAPGAHVVCVLSGGNVDVEQLRGLKWN